MTPWVSARSAAARAVLGGEGVVAGGDGVDHRAADRKRGSSWLNR